jgi:6-phosphofructokinase 1
VQFLLNPGKEAAAINGALTCLVDGQLHYLKFADLLDPKTRKTTVRSVDISKPAYKVAREYMIRLEREDFDNEAQLAALAKTYSTGTVSCTPEEFRKTFGYLVTDLNGGL